MMHAKPAYHLATYTGAASAPLVYTTAYRLWWVVITLTLCAAAAALWRLVPRKTE